MRSSDLKTASYNSSLWLRLAAVLYVCLCTGLLLDKVKGVIWALPEGRGLTGEFVSIYLK